MTEEWKLIDGLNGYYEISSFGRLRSLNHIDSRNRPWVGKILKLSTTGRGGYPHCRITINGKKITIVIHQMVARHFIPNPDNKPYVNHIDGSRDNNKVNNLEWVTHQENVDHAVKIGRICNPFGTKARNFISPVNVFRDGQQTDTLYGTRDAKDKGYDMRLIYAYFRGRQKTHRDCTFTKL